MYSLWDNHWSNLDVLQANRLPARAHFLPCETEAAALAGDFSGRAELLNGAWDFQWHSSPLLVEEAVFAAPPTGKQTIEVPMNWQYAGFGRLMYTDMDYPFPIDPPHIPAENETGVYKRHFTVNRLRGWRFFLRFEGVESAFDLYVNGVFAGYSQGSRMPSEFEISRLLREGENLLCVVVYQYCDGSYLEAQDMWWLGGIIRDVWLLRRPETYVEDLVLDPDYDLGSQQGILNIQPRFAGGKLEVAVYDGASLLLCAAVPKEGLQLRVPGVSSWNAEEPRLYTVLASLRDGEGRLREVIPLQVGFRHIEIVEGELRLNGRRILMKGFNRHEYDPETGRTVTRESTRHDLALIKGAGFNAVRASHYPNNSFFYELCNEIGLYVIDECDVEADGLGSVNQDNRLAEDRHWEAAHLDRVERMVRRDRNFACILLWSLGNESGYGPNFAAMYRWIKANEPTRPVHYEGDFQNQTVDVSSTMYTSLGGLYELDTQVNPKRPHILCEFGHAMGNGPGNLKEYCELALGSRRIQGLFGWEFMDHGVYQKRPDGKTVYGYGGDFGEKYHNANFCLDGFLFADGTPTPAFHEFAVNVANIKLERFDAASMTVHLLNRWDFLNLDVAALEYTLWQDQEALVSGTLPLPATQPGGRAALALPLALPGEPGGDIWLDVRFVTRDTTSYGPAGWQAGSARTLLEAFRPAPAAFAGLPQWTENRQGLAVSGPGFSLLLSAADGQIHGYTVDGELLMPSGPGLNLFRAYTDNDVKHRALWEKNHLDSLMTTVYSLKATPQADHLEVAIRARGGPAALAWGVEMMLIYRIDCAGTVALSMDGHFAGEDIPPELPKIGTQAQLSRVLKEVVWRGLGPEENYCDSQEAAMDGIWHKPIADMEVPYLRPQENGNRCRTGWGVAYGEKAGLAFATAETVDFSLRGHTDDALYRTAHHADLPASPYWQLNLDVQNAGLGSASCGPITLKQYLVHPLPFSLQLAFCPRREANLASGETALGRKARAYALLAKPSAATVE